MNAVALADGWVRGGAEGARESLAGFWKAVADSTPFELDLLHSLNGLGGSGDGSLPAPMNMMLGAHPAVLALSAQPLRPQPAARRGADALRLRAHPQPVPAEPLHRRHPGAHRQGPAVPHRTSSAHDALLASACLPTLHHAVEIDGEAYWDGGFTANPASTR